MKRLRKLALAWLALPEVARVGLVLFVLVVAGLLAGCAIRIPDSMSVQPQVQDENSCAASRNRWPSCIWGLMVFGRWSF